MSAAFTFVMAGGGTGGHVVPLLAVAEELRRRGQKVWFIGTRSGFEARLVPLRGFPIEWIEIGGLKRVGWRKTLRTLWQLPASVARCLGILQRLRPGALFSLGGYAAGPVMIAAWLRRIPMILMEPNAIPGMTNRQMARWVDRAMIGFPEAAAYFPPNRTELTGLPVRREFFEIPPQAPQAPYSILVTGGSRGARTLNRASREAWPLLAGSGLEVRFVLQSGAEEHQELERAFAASGLEGKVVAFIDDMPAAYAEADVVVSRAGAGGVSEIAAAGRPSILVPFPYAADDHQTANARSLAAAGAARLIPDRKMNGERLAKELADLLGDPEGLEAMGAAARRVAKPGSAARAADVLMELAEREA